MTHIKSKRYIFHYIFILVLVLSSAVLYGEITGTNKPLPTPNKLEVTGVPTSSKEAFKLLEEAKIAPLRYRLRFTGIIDTHNSKSAMININDKSEKLYKPGDIITENVQLETIQSEYITLRHIQPLEVLPLNSSSLNGDCNWQNDDAQSEKEATPKKTETSSKESLVDTEDTLAENTSFGITKIGDNHYSVSKDELINQFNSHKSLSQARLVAMPKGGFLVSNIEQNSIYEKLGIKKRDIIRKVNGKSIESFTDLLRLQRMIENDEILEIELYRVDDYSKADRLYYNLN